MYGDAVYWLCGCSFFCLIGCFSMIVWTPTSSFFFSFVRWKLQSPQWRWQCIAGPSGFRTACGLRECGLARFPFWVARRWGRTAVDVLLSDCQYRKGTALYGQCGVWNTGTYCFWVSYMHAFSIFVFAPVQRNWACFTWKSALEICSLLLLLLPIALGHYKG